MLVNKPLVLSVRGHHARVTHQIMLLVLSSAGAQGAKGSNEVVIMNINCHSTSSAKNTALSMISRDFYVFPEANSVLPRQLFFSI